MISDWELWACAEYIAKSKGDDADAFVQARISTLAALEDSEGAATWRDIETRLEALRRPSV